MATSTNKSLSIAILGYANSALVPPWDPDSCKDGLPGSEEAVVYTSAELAARGHRVTVYMNPPEDSKWLTGNPRWVHESNWNNFTNLEIYDLVLLWRRFDPEAARKRSKVVFFYPHDSPHQIPPGMMPPPFPRYDGICILSQHHWNQFSTWPGFKDIPYIISGNGLLPEHFSKPYHKPNPYSIGYFSNYARGLFALILIWPEIRIQYPEATLDVYYGRETWNTMPQHEFDYVIQKMEQYKTLGVTERGKVGHLELAEAMQTISVWAYPCLASSETFCITAIKAQMAGCIPVTTRIAALNETIHPDAPSIPHVRTMPDVQAYRDLLLQTLQRIRDTNPDSIEAERQRYIDFSQQFTWSACVDKWLTLYERVTLQ